MSLRLKLIILFIALAIGEGILIGYMAYSDSNKIVNNGQKREMSNTINRIDINISDKIRHINQVLNYASDNSAVQFACKNPSFKHLKSLKQYTEEFIENSITYSSDKINIFILGKDFELVFSNIEPIVLNSEFFDHFRKDDLSQAPLWIGKSKSLSSSHKENVISVIRSIFENNNLIGFIIIELPSEIFSDLLLGNQGMFRYQYLFILDKNSSVICSNPNIDMNWYNTIYERFDKGVRRFDFNWNGKSYYVCGQYNGITGWSTYSVIQSSDLFSHSRDIRSSIIFTVMIVAFFTAVLVVIISYGLTGPIHRLSGIMEKVQKGNFELRISSNRKDEIGRLGSTFDYMLEKIELLINQGYKKDIAQKNAELAALHAQINPHFLYNTLDSINWMLIDKGEDDISELILSLADMLRYSISDGSRMVSISTEIKYVESYLKIQKSRFGDRLNYDISVNQEAKNALIPKLLFQPLLENSIKHGIEPVMRNCRIRISIGKQNNKLSVIVNDDGAGIDNNILSELIQKCKHTDYEFHSESIGLVNTNRRMSLYFGKNYQLTIKSIKNQGTSIILDFPYTKEVSYEDHNC